MIGKIDFHIPELDSMKKYPESLYYAGHLTLLQNRKISIIGSRHPNAYSKFYTAELAKKLSQSNITIVSGGAMGTDAIAHSSTINYNTIMVAGTSLDIRYPSCNKKMIQEIEQHGLLLSLLKENTPSLPYNFPTRNEVIVALGEILIVSYADLNSGSMRSIEYALKMNKDIYVLPHELNHSLGTNKLLKENKAKAIYDIDDFISTFGNIQNIQIDDEFLIYCKSNPTFEEAVKKYSEKIFIYELEGKIKIENAKVYLN